MKLRKQKPKSKPHRKLSFIVVVNLNSLLLLNCIVFSSAVETGGSGGSSFGSGVSVREPAQYVQVPGSLSVSGSTNLYETQHQAPQEVQGQGYQNQGQNQYQIQEPVPASVPSNNYNYGWGWATPQIMHEPMHTPAPEPIKYNYHIIPDQPAKKPEHEHHHHHNKGWGWGWKRPKENKKKKKKGEDFFKSIIGIKALKIGVPIIIGKLFILVFILAGLAKAGTLLSPVSLPFLALPIAVVAALLFIPLVIAGFIILALTEGKKEETEEEEGHGHGHGWGWSRRRKGPRSRRNIKDEFLQQRIMTVMKKLPDLQLNNFSW